MVGRHQMLLRDHHTTEGRHVCQLIFTGICQTSKFNFNWLGRKSLSPFYHQFIPIGSRNGWCPCKVPRPSAHRSKSQSSNRIGSSLQRSGKTEFKWGCLQPLDSGSSCSQWKWGSDVGYSLWATLEWGKCFISSQIRLMFWFIYVHWRIRGGARDVRPHSRSNFFHFHAVFGEKLAE